MSCQKFRRAALADPRHLDDEVRAHGRECPACTQYLAEIVAFDAQLLQALRVPVSAAKVPARVAIVGQTRGRFLALAASVLVAVGIGAASWLVLVPQSLASDVARHMRGEAESWRSTTPATDARLEASMQRGGAWFTTMPGQFVYVHSCFFRGYYVPHLVMQSEQGPVTLLLLRHERLGHRETFDESGYRGVLLPVADGSVAVVTHGSPLPDELAARIAASIQWTSN